MASLHEFKQDRRFLESDTEGKIRALERAGSKFGWDVSTDIAALRPDTGKPLESPEEARSIAPPVKPLLAHEESIAPPYKAPGREEGTVVGLDEETSEMLARYFPDPLARRIITPIYKAESDFRADAKNRDSSAKGLGQFIDRTGKAIWNRQGQYKDFKRPVDDKYDPLNKEKNMAMSAAFLNKEILPAAKRWFTDEEDIANFASTAWVLGVPTAERLMQKARGGKDFLEYAGQVAPNKRAVRDLYSHIKRARAFRDQLGRDTTVAEYAKSGKTLPPNTHALIPEGPFTLLGAQSGKPYTGEMADTADRARKGGSMATIPHESPSIKLPDIPTEAEEEFARSDWPDRSKGDVEDATRFADAGDNALYPEAQDSGMEIPLVDDPARRAAPWSMDDTLEIDKPGDKNVLGGDVPTGAPEFPEEEKPGFPYKHPVLDRAQRMFTAGAVSPVASLMHAPKYIEDLIGVDTGFGTFTSEAADMLQERLRQLQPDDPNFLEQTVGIIGNFLPFIGTGLGAGAATLKLIPNAPQLAATMGATASGFIETMTIVGDFYNQQVASGKMEQEEALDAANKLAAANFVLNTTLNRFSRLYDITKFGGAKKSAGQIAGLAARGSGFESLQEGLQSVLQDYFGDIDIDFGRAAGDFGMTLLPSFLLGLVGGAGAGSTDLTTAEPDETWEADVEDTPKGPEPKGPGPIEPDEVIDPKGPTPNPPGRQPDIETTATEIPERTALPEPRKQIAEAKKPPIRLDDKTPGKPIALPGPEAKAPPVSVIEEKAPGPVDTMKDVPVDKRADLSNAAKTGAAAYKKQLRNMYMEDDPELLTIAEELDLNVTSDDGEKSLDVARASLVNEKVRKRIKAGALEDIYNKPGEIVAEDEDTGEDVAIPSGVVPVVPPGMKGEPAAKPERSVLKEMDKVTPMNEFSRKALKALTPPKGKLEKGAKDDGHRTFMAALPRTDNDSVRAQQEHDLLRDMGIAADKIPDTSQARRQLALKQRENIIKRLAIPVQVNDEVRKVPYGDWKSIVQSAMAGDDAAALVTASSIELPPGRTQMGKYFGPASNKEFSNKRADKYSILEGVDPIGPDVLTWKKEDWINESQRLRAMEESGEWELIPATGFKERVQTKAQVREARKRSGEIQLAAKRLGAGMRGTTAEAEVLDRRRDRKQSSTWVDTTHDSPQKDFPAPPVRDFKEENIQVGMPTEPKQIPGASDKQTYEAFRKKHKMPTPKAVKGEGPLYKEITGDVGTKVNKKKPRTYEEKKAAGADPEAMIPPKPHTDRDLAPGFTELFEWKDRKIQVTDRGKAEVRPREKKKESRHAGLADHADIKTEAQGAMMARAIPVITDEALTTYKGRLGEAKTVALRNASPDLRRDIAKYLFREHFAPGLDSDKRSSFSRNMNRLKKQIKIKLEAQLNDVTYDDGKKRTVTIDLGALQKGGRNSAFNEWMTQFAIDAGLPSADMDMIDRHNDMLKHLAAVAEEKVNDNMLRARFDAHKKAEKESLPDEKEAAQKEAAKKQRSLLNPVGSKDLTEPFDATPESTAKKPAVKRKRKPQTRATATTPEAEAAAQQAEGQARVAEEKGEVETPPKVEPPKKRPVKKVVKKAAQKVTPASTPSRHIERDPEGWVEQSYGEHIHESGARVVMEKGNWQAQTKDGKIIGASISLDDAKSKATSYKPKKIVRQTKVSNTKGKSIKLPKKVRDFFANPSHGDQIEGWKAQYKHLATTEEEGDTKLVGEILEDMRTDMKEAGLIEKGTDEEVRGLAQYFQRGK